LLFIIFIIMFDLCLHVLGVYKATNFFITGFKNKNKLQCVG